VAGLHNYGKGCAGFFVNMAKNMRVFCQYGKEYAGFFVNMATNVRFFWQYGNVCAGFLLIWQGMCGSFGNMATYVLVFC